jgi:sortase A
MRQDIIGKVVKSAANIKKSRHFLPILSGVIVILFFLFLQYNRLLISNVMAYVSPGNIDPQNIVIDPSADLTVPPESKLIIPKINVDVPVIYDIGNDYDSQMAAMQRGVAQFAIPGASSHPGQIGNTVIAGHSSNDLLDPGDYKFIFAQLDKLEVGDTIYANYNSIRYTYTVTKKEVVKPTDVNALVHQTTKPTLTLLTCTPLGTAISRLLVIAEQVSPDPNLSTAAPKSKAATTSIPGSSPTFFERLFGNNEY